MEDNVTSSEDYYYDEDDQDEGLLEESEAVPEEYNNSPSFKVITRESLIAAQREDIRKVMDLLLIREHDARSLLIYYRWDVQKLIDLFGEKGRDMLYAEAGMMIVDQVDFARSTYTAIQCGVCFDEVCTSTATAMDCGHLFCNECWTQHFIVKISNGQSRRIRCMEPKCNAVCNDEKIRHLVGARDPDLADKFDRFLLESYIEDNRRVKWCPSIPHCGNALRVDDSELCEVECACGVEFCFSCSSQAHSPCSCQMWELWSKKCKDESESVNWITVHTKLCPKCRKPVEKNGGCNWVSCVCGQAFCWLCAGATGNEHGWTNIQGHSCGKYNEDAVKTKEKAKTDLQRYMHYSNRYPAHQDSLKLESKQKEALRCKISTLEERDTSSKNYKWITNAFDTLCKFRHILSLTYPFAFYMFGDQLFENKMTDEDKEIKKSLFEDQQQQFEANVEKLSMIMCEEFDLYKEDRILDMKMRVIDVAVSTGNLCRNLYDCIQNDLLGSLPGTIQKIAPYKPMSVSMIV